MIRKIKFKNFYSFKKEQVLDFIVSKKKSDDYYQSYDGKQINKVAGFVGGNASGKTNVMRLLGFLNYFITNTQRENSSEDKTDTGFKSYAFAKSEDSNFSIEFETEKNFYFYKLVANSKKVIQEELSVKALKKNSKLIKVISRNKKDIKINKKLIKGVTIKKLKSIRDDVSVIAFINANYDENIIHEVYHYFYDSRMNVNEEGVSIPAEARFSSVASMYSNNPKTKKDMEEFIQNFDVGINKFKINKSLEISACHKISKKEYDLPIIYESHGTKTLFVELANILDFKNKSNLFVGDEIESGLHPQAVDKIIQYLCDNLKGKKKQFIFSTHSLNFLKKFDAQQIYLVDKKDNSSEVFRLDDLGVRPDENFFSKYMTGSYGAFPKIRI
jgi:uncharacterized protein